MLVCNHLTKSFKEKRAVRDLSFSIERGELFALLGSNGAGKTTTIKMILGLLPKGEGDIQIAQGTRIGYSPETPYFPPHLTGSEVLAYYGKLQGLRGKLLVEEIRRVMQATHLESNKIRVKHYSKGMLQRLAVAQALLGDPDMLILDEPTAGLDAVGRVEMMQLLREMNLAGKTILLNSHILGDVERICDRAVIIKDGVALTEWNRLDEHHQTLEEIFIEAIGGLVS